MPAGVLSARNLRSSTELKPENLSMWVSAEAPSPNFQAPGKFQTAISKTGFDNRTPALFGRWILGFGAFVR
jgi:hypothetical protein